MSPTLESTYRVRTWMHGFANELDRTAIPWEVSNDAPSPPPYGLCAVFAPWTDDDRGVGTLDDSIRQAIEAYLARSRLSERKLSAFAVGDPALIPRVRAGGSMRHDTADQLLTYMNEEPIGPAYRSEVEAFLSETGIGERNFGARAAGDPAFVTRLRSGASSRLSTVQRVQGWMRAHKDELIRAAAARKQAELRETSDAPSFGQASEEHARRLGAAAAVR